MKLRILLDTTFLIDVLRPRSGRRQELAVLAGSGNTLCSSVVNVAEIYAGIRSNETLIAEALLDSLELYPVTESIARRAGWLQNAYARKGITLLLPDMLVAATALEHDLTLLTDNRKDFPIPELKLHP